MKSAEELFAEALALHARGVKPFKIVKQILTAAGPKRVALTGTLKHAQLTFATGEEITFDGSEWRFHAREPEDTAEE